MIKDHEEKVALIYQYLIDKFGDTTTTAFKLHEVLISLAVPAKWAVSTTSACEHRKVIYNSCKSKACSSCGVMLIEKTAIHLANTAGSGILTWPKRQKMLVNC